uniref:Uncharacterized protein n=1 Tax=Rhizophora mucronata TaxID=61149 RepID=A0A2P2NMS8_RHIMU
MSHDNGPHKWCINNRYENRFHTTLFVH